MTVHPHSTPHFPVEGTTLTNGLRVVVQPDRSTPLVAVSMCYDAGSRHDPARRSGLAHLCEHLAYQGPRRPGRPGHPERLRRVGGLAQAVTSADLVRFTTLVPGRELGTALEVEAARLGATRAPWDEAEIERETRVLGAELSERPGRRARSGVLEQMNALVYSPEHPYHRPPAGRPDSIREITRGDVRGFFAAHYSPANAVLVLAGYVDADTAIEEAGRQLEGASTPSGAVSPPPAEPRPPHRGTRLVGAGTARETEVHLAWEVAGFGRDDWYAAALLMRALAVGDSSPLAKELIERQRVARDVRAHLVAMRDASTLAIGARAAGSVSHERLESALVQAVDRLLARGLSEPLLARARKKALTDHYHTVQRLDWRSDLCSRAVAFLGAPESLSAHPRRFLDMDVRTLDGLGARLRDDATRAILCLEPHGVAP